MIVLVVRKYSRTHTAKTKVRTSLNLINNTTEGVNIIVAVAMTTTKHDNSSKLLSKLPLQCWANYSVIAVYYEKD